MRNHSARTWAVSLGVLIPALAMPAAAQSWKTPSGSARAAMVSNAGGNREYASALLGDGIGQSETDAVSEAGLLSTGSATAVTSGSESVDRSGVQSVATAANVNVLNGRITADRLIAISTVADVGTKTQADGDGSGATNLVIDGVAYGDDVAPNTRVDLPGVGYVVLNEQVKTKGRGVGLTVNMVHVYLADQREVVVATATSASGS